MNEVIGDYEVIEEWKKSNKKYVKLRCRKCNRVQDISYVGFKKRINEHGKICSKNVSKELGGYSKCHFYRIWCNMRTRTTNNNSPNWKNYGGKGINSDEFEYFVDFYDAMYESYRKHIEIYGEKETTLDRIDNEGNYCKNNCRWLTWNEQANNKSTLLKFKAKEPNGMIHEGENLKKFCEEHGLNYPSVISGIFQGNKTWKNGWYFEVV